MPHFMPCHRGIHYPVNLLRERKQYGGDAFWMTRWSARERSGLCFDWTGRSPAIPLQVYWCPVDILPKMTARTVGRLQGVTKWCCRGVLLRCPRARNPGEFDYGSYLLRKRIYARLYLLEGSVEQTGLDRWSMACALEPVRAFVQSSLDRFLPDPESRAILRALLLGDRRQLDNDTRDRFARMGLLHLLAVSGLHVMVVGMILYRLLGPLLYRLRLSWRTVDILRVSCTVFLLLGYMLLTGCSASVVRAVVMASLMLSATSLQRPGRSLNSLGMAVCVLLVAAPTHLFEAGFQLSVSAVAGILSLAPLLAVWIPVPSFRLGEYIHSGTTVTVAATIGTLPIALYHFGQVGLGGLVLNLPGIPLTTGALVAGAAAVVFGGVFPALGEILGAASGMLASTLLHVSMFGDRFIGWSVVQWSVERPLPLVILTLIGVCLAVWRRPRLRWRCVALVLILLAGDTVQGIASGRYRPSMDVIYMDVGQGDAALLRLPNGDGVLIDAGARSSFPGQRCRKPLRVAPVGLPWGGQPGNRDYHPSGQ